MNLVFQVALGILLGLLGSVLAFWIIAVTTQYLAGDRYFTPSRHIVKEKMKEREQKIENMFKQSKPSTKIENKDKIS